MRNGPYELVIAPDGYPGKRYRGRYAYEHRVSWWRETGSNPDSLVIHHKDEAKRNNTPTNLEAMARGAHSKHHHAVRRPATLVHAICACGKAFTRRKGQSARFCSRPCIGRFCGGLRPAKGP